MKGLYVRPELANDDRAEELFVCKVMSEKTSRTKCPKAGDKKMSWSSGPEEHTCPLCGTKYTKRWVGKPRDPEWDYTHPEERMDMTEVHLIAFVPMQKGGTQPTSDK